MDLKYKISITEKAQKDIVEIASGILEVSKSVETATKWANKIYDGINALCIFPLGCPKFTEDNESIRTSKVGKYKIIFEVFKTKKVVEILRIVYARRAMRLIKLR